MHAKGMLLLIRPINKWPTHDHMSNYKASPCSFINTAYLYVCSINNTVFIVTLTVVQQSSPPLHGSPQTYTLTQKFVVLT